MMMCVSSLQLTPRFSFAASPPLLLQLKPLQLPDNLPCLHSAFLQQAALHLLQLTRRAKQCELSVASLFVPSQSHNVTHSLPNTCLRSTDLLQF